MIILTGLQNNVIWSPIKNSDMKKSFIILFIFSSYFATAQISGSVIDEKGQPIEFATVYNLRNKVSSITNVEGEFNISGLLGDSIRIQHLNYEILEVKVLDEKKKYVLTEKINNLSEVPITAGFVMFKKSCENTYKTFKQLNISRGYLRYFCTNDKDTTQVIDVDLDIVQQKLKDFNKGEKISIYKVQERNRIIANNPFLGIEPMFLNINFINNWASSLGHAKYQKIEEDNFFKYYFFGNDSVDQHKFDRIEVVIQRSDTCLISVNYFSNISFINKEGKSVKIKNHYWHIKYEYLNGFAYLSESVSNFIVYNPKNNDNELAVSLIYRTYDNGSENLKRRPKGRAIIQNIWLQGLIKNRYQEEFWDCKEYLNFDVKIFDSLLNMNVTVENGSMWSVKNPLPLGYKYYIDNKKF